MTAQHTDVPPVLELHGVDAGYGRATVLRDIRLAVPAGRVVALLGPNGAGKTTLLHVASGLLEATRGEILFCGKDVTRSKPFQRTQEGLCLIPEGRGIFPSLSVRENLALFVPAWKDDRSVDAALEAFPVLGDRLSQRAGSMSGGQQQMLALARCYLAEPKLVLLDEVSMGLAPRIIDEIFEALGKLAQTGVALLLVEQYVTRALEVADHVYLLNRGEVAFSGAPSDLDEEALNKGYLGDTADAQVALATVGRSHS